MTKAAPPKAALCSKTRMPPWLSELAAEENTK